MVTLRDVPDVPRSWQVRRELPARHIMRSVERGFTRPSTKQRPVIKGDWRKERIRNESGEDWRTRSRR